jgi:hypothetical protein
MKSYKQMVNEVLTKSTPAGEWIDDFVHSKNPKFADKSAAKRKQMALAAYYSKKDESVEEAAAVSQNTASEVDMNEEHLVHVNDGSKYDEQPHKKDVDHVMAGVKIHKGEHAGASDKGAFFKFPSKEHAQAFKSHVNKCPHRSCDADLTEGYPGDNVDPKKVLKPSIPLTQKKKTVKDFLKMSEAVHPSVMAMAKVSQAQHHKDSTDRWSYDHQLTKRGFKKNGNEYTHPSGHTVTIAKHGQSWTDSKGKHGMNPMNLGAHLDKELKEGFLSSSEEDDIKNLDRYNFFKKYGRSKSSHRSSRGIRTADVEKYTEDVDEAVKKPSRGYSIIKTKLDNIARERKFANGELKIPNYSEKGIETPKIKTEGELNLPNDEKWTQFSDIKKNKKGEK